MSTHIKLEKHPSPSNLAADEEGGTFAPSSKSNLSVGSGGSEKVENLGSSGGEKPGNVINPEVAKENFGDIEKKVSPKELEAPPIIEKQELEKPAPENPVEEKVPIGNNPVDDEKQFQSELRDALKDPDPKNKDLQIAAKELEQLIDAKEKNPSINNHEAIAEKSTKVIKEFENLRNADNPQSFQPSDLPKLLEHLLQQGLFRQDHPQNVNEAPRQNKPEDVGNKNIENLNPKAPERKDPQDANKDVNKNPENKPEVPPSKEFKGVNQNLPVDQPNILKSNNQGPQKEVVGGEVLKKEDLKPGEVHKEGEKDVHPENVKPKDLQQQGEKDVHPENVQPENLQQQKPQRQPSINEIFRQWKPSLSHEEILQQRIDAHPKLPKSEPVLGWGGFNVVKDLKFANLPGVLTALDEKFLPWILQNCKPDPKSPTGVSFLDGKHLTFADALAA